MTAQAMPKLDEAPATRVVHKGTQDLPKDAWVPFEWDEPRRGHQVCGENNIHIGIGKEVYYLSGDGTIMPIKKGQPPPDLKYFNQAHK